MRKRSEHHGVLGPQLTSDAGRGRDGVWAWRGQVVVDRGRAGSVNSLTPNPAVRSPRDQWGLPEPSGDDSSRPGSRSWG
jgi:hypothetical protein